MTTNRSNYKTRQEYRWAKKLEKREQSKAIRPYALAIAAIIVVMSLVGATSAVGVVFIVLAVLSAGHLIYRKRRA